MAAPAPGASFPMDSVTAEKEIYQLVTSSDLSELTSAKVRKHLEEQFGMDFTPYKVRVNEMTRDAIAKMQTKKPKKETTTASSSDEDDDEEKNGKSDKKKDSSSDSDSDPGILSTDRKPKKKNKVKASVNDFDDMVSNIKSSRRAAASKAMKDIRKSAGPGAGRAKKPKSEKDKDEDNSGKFGRMTKLCFISSDLQEIVGNQYMKRCDVVKALWDYIKTNDLFDPKDKRLVKCDSKLETIFKRKRFRAFGMAKFLTNHVINPRDMGPEYEKEANDEMERLKSEWLERKRLREEGAAEEEDEVPEKKVKKDEEEEKTREDNDAVDSDEGSD